MRCQVAGRKEGMIFGSKALFEKNINVVKHQKFQLPKMEVLYLIRMFCGVGFPLHEPHIQLSMGEYLHLRCLKFLMKCRNYTISCIAFVFVPSIQTVGVSSLAPFSTSLEKYDLSQEWRETGKPMEVGLNRKPTNAYLCWLGLAWKSELVDLHLDRWKCLTSHHPS